MLKQQGFYGRLPSKPLPLQGHQCSLCTNPLLDAIDAWFLELRIPLSAIVFSRIMQHSFVDLRKILENVLATVWKATNNGVVSVLFYAALYLQPKGSELYGGNL
jgi:hypothetical protein